MQLFSLIYNLAWLMPIVLTFSGTLDYTTGFAIFAAVCVIRFIANLYANNRLNANQYSTFLFRS